MIAPLLTLRVAPRALDTSGRAASLSTPEVLAVVQRHGSAKLAALVREAVAGEVERLIGVLDTIDGDADREFAVEDGPIDDDELDDGEADREPWLGWPEARHAVAGFADVLDGELDVIDGGRRHACR